MRAPARGVALGQPQARGPFGAAVGLDALGPDLTRALAVEVDDHAARIEPRGRAAPVDRAVSPDGLEFHALHRLLQSLPGNAATLTAPRCHGRGRTGSGGRGCSLIIIH